MAPEERREALVDVYLRLARTQGRRPSTSEIAKEAGVAEGTIFRAFPTKGELEDEAVQAAFCPEPVRRDIARIDPSLPPRDRLVAFTRIMQQRFTDVFGLMAALGLTQPPSRAGHHECFARGRHQTCAAVTDEHGPEHQPLLDSIHDLIQDAKDDFTIDPRDVIHRLRLLTFSASHPGIADGQTLTPEEIVDTILDGLLRPAVGGTRHDADFHRFHRNPLDPHAGKAPSVATEPVADVRPDLIREGS